MTATLDYTPTHPGGHPFVPQLVERPEGDRVPGGCAECGAPMWNDAHSLTEGPHRDLTATELGGPLYAVEASDDGGRSYVANGLRWSSPEAARRWGSGLAMRWFGCTHIRVARVTDDWVARTYIVDEVVSQVL
jgi:hypothetical protein